VVNQSVKGVTAALLRKNGFKVASEENMFEVLNGIE
jgi:uncharacterized protein YbbK (DUF523 family)